MARCPKAYRGKIGPAAPVLCRLLTTLGVAALLAAAAAGTGAQVGPLGDGGLATAAQLLAPSGVAVGPDGSLYIADFGNHRIRKVSADGVITTVAGSGPVGRDQGGFGGDGGPAVDAQLNAPSDIAGGPDGSLFIADRGNRRIRKVSSDGLISTVAGTGERGYGGDGGPATAAQLVPIDVAVGRDGSLYIADRDNHRIRKVSPDGVITTVAGSGERSFGGFAGDGGPATAAKLASPSAVAVGRDGSLYIADTGNYRIRRVSLDGTITTVAGGATAVSAATAPCLVPCPGGDGRPATAAQVGSPIDVAVGPDGSLYIANSDRGNSRVRRVRPDGIITTVAGRSGRGDGGDGGRATAAQLFVVQSVAVGPDGSLFIAEAYSDNNRVRRVAPHGTITTVAGRSGPPVPPAATPEAPPIRALPRTGSGPGGLSLAPTWLPAAGAVGGLVALGAGVAVRRWRRQRPRPYER